MMLWREPKRKTTRHVRAATVRINESVDAIKKMKQV